MCLFERKNQSHPFKEADMSSIADGSVCIQTSAETQAATPSWLGEVALVASHLQKQGILNKISERVRFARRRFGRYDVLDFPRDAQRGRGRAHPHWSCSQSSPFV